MGESISVCVFFVRRVSIWWLRDYRRMGCKTTAPFMKMCALTTDRNGLFVLELYLQKLESLSTAVAQKWKP